MQTNLLAFLQTNDTPVIKHLPRGDSACAMCRITKALCNFNMQSSGHVSR